MTWVKVYPAVIAVACVLVILANAPAVLLDPLVTAVAQIRKNAAKTETTVTTPNTETPYPEETSVLKSRKGS